ncbi:MAG: ATP-binding protein [Syntrophaceae bacterium]|nr:ATP-binding protein [Syntrophaceae bacterium]
MKQKNEILMEKPFDHYSVLETSSEITKLGEIKSWAEKCWRELGFGTEKMEKMLLCVEEVFANICFHGYKGEPGLVRFECFNDNKRAIVFKIYDWAAAFDITSLSRPDTDQPLADRQIGGLGVLLIKEMVDEINWILKDGANMLSLIFYADI